MSAPNCTAIDIAFLLNGQSVSIRVEANELLIDVVRDRLHLKGTKRSCDVEICGTCTILVNGLPVSSCTMLAADVDGQIVLTIEGVAKDGELSRVQKAFVSHAAIQCGFCTPGIILATTALLKINSNPTDADIRHFLHGNICRCTGYVKILEAVKSLA